MQKQYSPLRNGHINLRPSQKGLRIFVCGVLLFGFFISMRGLAAQNAKENGGNNPRRHPPINSPLLNNVKKRQQERENEKSKDPAPSALPSQQLAAQAPKVQKGADRKSCLLRSLRAVGSSDIVEIVLEGAGTVEPTAMTVTTDEKTQVDGGKMELIAGFRYEERLDRTLVSGNKTEIRTLREYEQAGMKRNYNGTVTRPLLDQSKKNIVSEYDGKKLTQYSPDGSLKSDQYLLIDEIPANTTILDLLLPNKETKLGDEWSVSNETLCALLGWDAVENNTFRLVLTAIIDDMAQVDIFLGDPGKNAKGEQLPSTLQGASLGASIAADIQGKFQFDLKAHRMTWFGMTITEKRSESLVEPGLDWKASIRIRIAPLEKPEKLTNQVAVKMREKPTPEILELYYNGQKGPWSFRHARTWRMIEDGEESAALTFIASGDGVAQCNIISNGKIDLASMPSMEGYKEELKKGLGDRFGRFVTESDYIAESGDHVYAVMIDGQYEGIPFRWIYYLITDAAGHQVSVMFEILAEKLSEFGDSGREIVDSFRMLFPDDEILSTEDEEEEGDFDRIEGKPEKEGIDLESIIDDSEIRVRVHE